jgi:hypothetical protein
MIGLESFFLVFSTFNMFGSQFRNSLVKFLRVLFLKILKKKNYIYIYIYIKTFESVSRLLKPFQGHAWRKYFCI